MSTTPLASTLQSVQQDEAKVDIMIDSGAATHVCPPWFAPNSPMYTLQHGQGPQLRTATDENIQVYGYKWVLMTNVNKQQLVVPFFVCEVTQPIMSVTRPAEQGFSIQLNETPTVTHTKGFNTALVQRDGLYFMTMEFVNVPVNIYHATGSTSNDPRNNSKDHTSDLDTNRSPEEQK